VDERRLDEIDAAVDTERDADVTQRAVKPSWERT
jgi:hypothetical protein